MEFLAGILPYAVLVAMFATLGALILGVVGMARGGEFDDKYANKLMSMRVGLQAAAIALFALLLLLVRGWG
jgi:hypothetical protein